MNNFNNLSNHIQSVVVKEPAGILTPGVIILGKTKLSPEVVTNNEYYPPKIWESYSPAPGEDIPEKASLPSIDNYQVGDKVKVENDYYILSNYPYSVFYQYKVSNDKFIGFIGDLAEYGFKHIPEKFYYNNISNLDLLNEDSQYTIGSRFPVLKAVSDHAVFTEICKEDYSNPNSLLESAYDKFRPHYFGTAIQGDRTVLMFIVPPGYNKVSIAGEAEIYNREDYFNYYGPCSQLQDSYMEYMESQQTPSFHAVRPGSSSYYDASSTANLDLTPNAIDYSNIVTEPRSLVIDYDTAVGLVDNNPDDIDTGGRGKNRGQNYNGNTTVISIIDEYSLIYNDHTGTELVIPNDAIGPDQYYDTDTNSGLYDYWKSDSPYTFKNLRDDYEFYIKTDPKNSRLSYELIEDNGSGNLGNFIVSKIDTLEKEYILEETDSVASNNPNLVDLTGLTSSISLKIDNSGYYYKFDADYPMLRLTKSTSKLNSYIYNKAKDTGNFNKFWEFILKIGNFYYRFKEAKYYFYIKLKNSSTSYTFKRISELDKWTEQVKTETSGIYKKFTSNHTRYFGSIYYNIPNQSYSIVPNILPDRGWRWKLDPNYFSVGGNLTSLDTLINSLPDHRFANFSQNSHIECNNKYYTLVEEVVFVKDYENLPGNSSGNSPHSYVTPINVDLNGDKPESVWWNVEPTNWLDKEKNYYQYINGKSGGKSSLEINLKDDFEDYYRLVKIVISPKETKEYEWRATAETSEATEVSSLPLLPNSEYGVGDIVRINNGGSYQFFALTYTGSETIKSINIVNLGYKTSENPLKNLDKYLIREEGYVPKYSKTQLGVVDLTSGTYISKDFRKNNEEDTVSGKRFSYRKVYRKGQSALVGIPDGLKDKIIDIKQIVQNSEVGEDSIELGSIIYDYFRGIVYRYRSFKWKELTDFEEEPFYKEVVDTLPESLDVYNEGDIIKLRNSYEFYILTESNDGTGLIKQEFFNEDYLFRYHGEYFLWKDNQTGYPQGDVYGTVYCDGLVRGNILGVRTWISTCNNNSKNLPWASRSWMSNDGELLIEDKVWVIITSGNSKQKLLGTIKKREKGTCLEIKSKIPIGGISQEVKLNGAVMKAGIRYDGHTKERIVSLYQKRRLHFGQEELADITKDLVFKNKINYITVFNYEN